MANLERSMSEWRRMIGSDEDLELKYRDSGAEVDSPKHGKLDPENTPHVGGNTWAGGTGGRDTAGLGGKGGPYRLDAGHQVGTSSALPVCFDFDTFVFLVLKNP